jgi:hypothetical protein
MKNFKFIQKLPPFYTCMIELVLQAARDIATGRLQASRTQCLAQLRSLSCSIMRHDMAMLAAEGLL